MRKYLSCLMILLLFFGTVNGPPAFGQKTPKSDPKPDRNTAIIRAEVAYVIVNVTVLDPYSRVVTGLEKVNFEVYEDGKKQKIRKFSSEEAPVSIGLVVDVSGSMSNKIEKVMRATELFMETCNKFDEFFLTVFSDGVRRLTDFTSDTTVIQNAFKPLLSIGGKGRTALFDAVYDSLSYMVAKARKFQPQTNEISGNSPPPEKRALLLISDGGDNYSRYTEKEVDNLLKEADTQLYVIGIYDQPGYRSTPEEQRGPLLLQDLAEASGGRVFPITENDIGSSFGDTIKDTAKKIGIELRKQYVIGYYPENTNHDGRYRKIKVKVIAPRGLPPLKVYTKTGYYSSQN